MKKENEENENLRNENCVYKNADYSNTVDTEENEEHNSKFCVNEKKIIIYLIVLALVLIYYSLFFIHNINFRGTIKDTQSTEIRDSQNKDGNNNTINGIAGNNTISGIVNAAINAIKNYNKINNAGNNANNNGTNGNTGSNTNNNGTNGNTGGNTNNNETNGNTGSNVNDNGINGNTGSNTNNNGANGNTGNNTGNGQTGNLGGDIVNNEDRFKIMQGTESWKDLKNLDIFNNYYFENRPIIAPGVYGKYSFTVENYRENKMMYNLNFIEENKYNINMVYKLKLNGSYIAGNEQRFVKCNELNKEDLVINAKTSDVFTIEWKWQDNNNDTQIGKTENASYTIHISVDATELEN